jgi:hypothetical protein
VRKGFEELSLKAPQFRHAESKSLSRYIVKYIN